jgi:pyridinium-3,5-bisthiocarboxylic acid mononucleotide nickel chelatase
MTIAYFDCFSGISGDMVLGALVDAGCDLARLEAELRRLAVCGWTISAQKVKRGTLAATQVKVETSEHHPHRSLQTILDLIGKSELAPRVAERASRIFRRLGEAEARIHNIPVEKVHFHEVGAVDAIVDIVGACVGFELLGVDELACSALNVGGARVLARAGAGDRRTAARRAELFDGNQLRTGYAHRRRDCLHIVHRVWPAAGNDCGRDGIRRGHSGAR